MYVCIKAKSFPVLKEYYPDGACMDRLLIIGNGLLGREVARLARHNFKTAITYNANPITEDGFSSYHLDITGNLDLIKSLKPDYIILTAAMTNVDQCEVDPEGAWKVNALGPKNVAKAAKEIDAKLIYISTDYVFDGEKSLYKEGNKPNPINHYGKTKLAGERFVQEICEDYVIARTSVLYGYHPTRQNFATWAIEELKKGNRINIVTDQYNSPTLASNLAEMILKIKDETGIFHASGSERISRFDFASKIAEIFGLDENLITPRTSNQLSWKAIRPKDSSLNVSKISRLAKPLNIYEGVKIMEERF